MKKLFILILLLPITVLGQITTRFDTIYDEEYDAVKDTFINKMHLVKYEGMMRDSLKVGLWKGWYDSGQLVSSGGYVDNYKVGLWQRWYDNGQLASIGEYAVVGKNKIRIFVDDTSGGVPDTISIRRMLKDNYSLETGLWVSYYSNGNLRDTGKYLSSGIIIISGPITVIDEKGNMQDYFVWTPEPEPMQTENWKTYGENGNLLEEENFNDDGLQSGIQYHYYEGKLHSIERWENGRKISDSLFEERFNK